MASRKPGIFDLFWIANRADEHMQDRALGLLDKRLTAEPDNFLARVCKACLMIQTSHQWDSADTRQRAIKLALELIRDTDLNQPDRDRGRLAFAIGISLAQLPSEAGFDSASAGILRALTRGARLSAEFSTEQRQEAFVALGAVSEALGRADEARDAFVAARALGLDHAAHSFGDYQELKSLSHL